MLVYRYGLPVYWSIIWYMVAVTCLMLIGYTKEVSTKWSFVPTTHLFVPTTQLFVPTTTGLFVFLPTRVSVAHTTWVFSTFKYPTQL